MAFVTFLAGLSLGAALGDVISLKAGKTQKVAFEELLSFWNRLLQKLLAVLQSVSLGDIQPWVPDCPAAHLLISGLWT